MPEKCFYLYSLKALYFGICTFIAPKSYSLANYLKHLSSAVILQFVKLKWLKSKYYIVYILLHLFCINFTFIANFFRLQASDFLRNHYLNINKFILALSKEVKIYSYLKFCGTVYFDIARSRVSISCLASCLIGICCVSHDSEWSDIP
jgi:hypothetical protein